MYYVVSFVLPLTLLALFNTKLILAYRQFRKKRHILRPTRLNARFVLKIFIHRNNSNSSSDNINTTKILKTRSALRRAHLPPTTVFRRLKTTRRCFYGAQYEYVGFSRRNKILRCSAYDSKPRVAAAETRAHYGFSWRNKIPRCSAYAMGESNPDWPDTYQKSISSSMSRHLSTHNISSKSMHAFLSNLAHRQTDERGRAAENINLLRCRRWINFTIERN